MPFRFEKKYFIPLYDKKSLIMFVRQLPGLFSQIHYERQVNSLYFDTPSFAFYRQSVECSSIRKKVRIRWYGENLANAISPTLEIKQKMGSVNSKKAVKSTKKVALNKICELFGNEGKMYLAGTIPTVLVSYTRIYFENAAKTARVTIDTNIKYMNSHLNAINQPGCIIEVKYNSTDAQKVLNTLQKLNGKPVRFSKYCKGKEAIPCY